MHICIFAGLLIINFVVKQQAKVMGRRTPRGEMRDGTYAIGVEGLQQWVCSAERCVRL